MLGIGGRGTRLRVRGAAASWSIHTDRHKYNIHTWYTYIHTHIKTYRQAYIKKYVHTYIHTYMHTYIRTMHVNVRISMCSCERVMNE